MDQNNFFNTGTGLSVFDNQSFTRIEVDEIIVNNDAQFPGGITLPVDIVPLQDNRNALNALTSGEVIVKGASDDTYSSIPTSNDYSSSTNDIVRKTSGVIKTNKLTAGNSDLSTGDININNSSSNSLLNIVAPSSLQPQITLIRNASSTSFGGDGASDWKVYNNSGHLDFDRGNAGLTNGYVSPFRISFTNAIELNQYRSGAIIDHCPLRHYRQVSGQTNNYYVDVFPDSSVAGTFQQKLPAESGTYITDNTSEYVNLNTMNTNINALTDTQLMIKTGTNTFSSTANNSSNWDTAYTQSTNFLSDFNSQTTSNLLFRDGTSSFGNIAIDNAFNSGSLIVQKDSGTVKSKNFLAEQAGNGYMFQSFTNSAVISYLYHSNNSGLGVAVEMPSTSGILGLTSQIAWNISGSNISTKNSNDNVGVGTPSSFPSRLTFGGGTESKICLFDGGSSNIYGFGVSDNQLNYHVNTTSDRHVFYANGTNGDGTELMRIQGNKQIFLGQSSGDGVAGSGDVIITNRNASDVELEFRSDDTGLTSANDYLIGKIKAGFTSGSYTSAYFKFQTHHANNTTLNDTFELKGSNATLNGTLIINQESAGIAKIILQDQTDHDDVDILFQGYNGSTLIDNAVIRTENNYLNFETSNNTPMNGIRLSTNNTLAMTIDNNQHVELVAGLKFANGSFTNELNTLTLTANRAINFPDNNGEVALTNNQGIWTASGNDITYGTGDVKILNSGRLQVDELQGTLGSSTKIDLAPGGGNIDFVVPNSAGGITPNVDINFKTDTKVRMNLNSIDGIVFHENFIFKNTVGSTYFPLTFNGSVANSLNVGTAVLNLPSADLDMGTGDLTMTSGDLDVQSGGVEIGTGNLHMTSGNVYIGSIPASVPIGVQTFHLAHGVTTAGVEGEFGVCKIGNGLADYAMFSHASHFTTGNYALLQQNDGETFLNCASAKQIHFRVNNSTRGGIDDESGKERTFFVLSSSVKPEYDSNEKVVAKYVSIDNPTFRVFATGGTQNERCVMYSQVVVQSGTTGFTQQALPLQDYGTQPGYVSGSPGFAFRACDPNRHVQIDVHFSGYTSATNALQTIRLQLYSKQPSGTNAWVDVAEESFYVNDRYQHIYISFTKIVQLTYAFYSFARLTLVSGTFTGDTGDIFSIRIDQLPRQTR